MAHMKKQNFAGLIVGLCLCASPFLAPAQNIMPMGDSVTARGDNPESSYRYWLWQRLQGIGFTGAFVGNQFGVSDGAPLNSDFDQHYEGGGPADDAWGTQDGIDNLGDANSHGADIVLLDLGSNDFDGSQSAKDTLALTQANLETIMDGLAAQNPGIVILLAEPTPWVTQDREERRFMSGLSGAVARAAKVEKKAGVNVIVVNLRGGFNARTDTKDGTHPNVRGEQKIANRYFQALRRVL
jgi:lysophospholipase L1-like esterase